MAIDQLRCFVPPTRRHVLGLVETKGLEDMVLALKALHRVDMKVGIPTHGWGRSVKGQ